MEINTIADEVEHYEFLRSVVEGHQLHVDAGFLGGATNSMSVEAATTYLGAIVSSENRFSTLLVDVSATHTDAHVAQRLASIVARDFVDFRLKQRVNSAKDVNKYLINEADELKTRIEAAEREIQAYKKTHSTVSFDDIQGQGVDEVGVISAEYMLAKKGRLQLEADLAQIRLLGSDISRIALLPSIQKDSSVEEMKQRIAEQQAEVSKLERIFKPKYPKLIQANLLLSDIESAFEKLIGDVSNSVAIAHQVAVDREQSLLVAVKEAEASALLTQDLAIPYNILVRDRNTDNAIYESVLRRIKEAGLSEDFKDNLVQFVDAARVPQKPSGGNWVVTLMAFVVVAIVLSFVIVVGFYLADSSIKTVDECEAYLGVPVIGSVPMNPDRVDAQSRRVALSAPHSKCSEAFRSLRTSIRLLGPESERKIVVFTSADPGEGKSFACSNYAITEAQQGKRTLLIDLDLRRPTIGKSWELKEDSPGVTSILVEGASLDSVVQKGPIEKLYFLTAGPLVPNPAEQLGGERALQLIEEAGREFDRIVIDTAPVNAVSDTLS